jgi:hypothetical protein
VRSAEPSEEFALTNSKLDRVQDFLAELRQALVEMAQRPVQSPVDVAPLVKAVQAGIDRSSEQTARTAGTLQMLTEQLDSLGERVGHGVSESIQNAFAQAPSTQAVDAPPPPFVRPRADRQLFVLGGAALLVICWSFLFFTTGWPRLALAALVAANVTACGMLLVRPNQS